ncbi:fructosamine kinase family protein [Salsipaludibacter albus]|uniref:fructosamine kinase family protein n=1 Tax=Salsipaludibacter albus TaxID=2849650 RepID=UPI0023674C80|nr:fructosamine kinase family protein [Salsipaludibacter albus]
MFAGIPEVFFRAYDDAWPRDDGWQDREPLLQLYHLLVHVEMFGHGYVPGIVSRLDAAGL